jgi:hypothetical protein
VEYVSIRETRFSEIMALKATLEPMFMSVRRQVQAQVRMIALTSNFFLGLTWDIHLLNGKPLSLAKAQVCREVDMLNVIVPAKTMMRSIMLRALIPWMERLLFLKIQRMGYAEGSLRAESRSVRQKRKAMRVMMLRSPLRV